MMNRNRVGSLCVLLATALLVAACGSSSNSSTATGSRTSTNTPAVSGSLTNEVAALKQRPTTIGTTQPLGKPLPKAGTIDYLECGDPGCNLPFVPYLQSAAKAAGWNVDIINEGLTPQTVKAAWDQAVRNNPDAMVLTGGFPTSIFQTELAVMAKRHVPIVDFAGPEATPPAGITGIIYGGSYFAHIGKLWADAMTVASGGKANVLNVYVTTFPATAVAEAATVSELKKVCPGCTSTSFNLPATSIGAGLPQTIAGRVQGLPNVDWLTLPYTSFEKGVPAALAAVGRTPGLAASDVKIISQDKGTAEIGDIMSGKSYGTINLATPEAMWRSMDIILRAKLGLSVAPSTVPSSYTYWLLTKDNVPAGLGSAPNDGALPNAADYQTAYKQLWGVK